jgi:tetratricopeptide (TPR) repeat protein
MAQKTLRDYLLKTEDALKSNRIEDALSHTQLMLAHFPEALEVQRLLGEIYLAQGRLEDAQHVFDWVLTNDPENVVAYCNRAHVSERLTEYDVALDCYQQAYELSRGQKQIRAEFNRLSENVGQKGFMFSRAGLARLYMRGDMLSQALLEWEAVLGTTPDRLDARTGLLETYWRADLLDDAEQLAERILQDVPSCLKALLLLAKFTFTKDNVRSQNLLRQAKTLDPELTTAQTLFADLLTSQPNDPFLLQLKKAPVLLPEPQQTPKQAPQHATPLNQLVSTQEIPPPPNKNDQSDLLTQWGSNTNWNTALPTSTASLTNGPQSGWEHELANGHLPATAWHEIDGAGDSQEPQKHTPEPWELLEDALNKLSHNTPGAYSLGDLPLWEDELPSQNQPSLGQASSPSWLTPTTPEQNSPPIDLNAWEQNTTAINPNEQEQNSLATSPHTWEQNSPAVNPHAWEQDSPPIGSHTSEQNSPAVNHHAWEQNSPPIGSHTSEQNSTAVNHHAWEQNSPPIGSYTSEQNSTAVNHHAWEQNSPPIGSYTSEQNSTAVNHHAWEQNTTTMSINSWDQSQSPSGTNMPAAPSWLNMLSPTATSSTSSELAPLPQEQLIPPLPEKETQAETSPAWPFPSETENASEILEDDKESFFSPSWLKSLGATSDEEAGEPKAQPPIEENPAPLSPQQAPAIASSNVEPEPEPTPVYESGSDTNSYLLWLQANSPHNSDVTNNHEYASALMNQTQAPQETLSNPWDDQKQPPFSAAISSAQPTVQPEVVPEPSEQNLVTTLEELEQSLRTKGFISLEPHSLTTIATQASPVKEEIPPFTEPEVVEEKQTSQPLQPASSQPEPQQEQASDNNPSRTSALAQLGNFVRQSMPQPPQGPSTSSSFEIVKQTEEPAWLQALKNTSSLYTPVPTPPIPSNMSTEYGAPAAYTATWHDQNNQQQLTQETLPPVPPTPTLSPIHTGASIPEQGEMSVRPSTPVNKTPIVPPTPASKTSATLPVPDKELIETVKTPPMRGNPLLDNELETTMKRPAIRLQPLQHRSPPTQGATHSLSRTQGSERGEKTIKTPPLQAKNESSNSPRDRLVKGYQHQLVGNYDEAMNEYRLIIRSTTDLLNEVISNIQALLKLAPHYSPGYRVLGDAYMRQGEYQQAMEVYNKALSETKIKKVRG